jgi:hypothetical protein
MTHRCSICNKTDSEELASELGEFTNDPFLEDPSDPAFEICLECYESIRDTLDEFGDDADGDAFEYEE